MSPSRWSATALLARCRAEEHAGRRFYWLLVAAFGCVPSVDLGLPDEPGIESWAIFSEDQPTILFDAAEPPPLLAVGDRPFYGVSFPRTLDQLVLPGSIPLGTEGPNLATDRSRSWSANRVKDVLDWMEVDEIPPRKRPPFDVNACLTERDVCVEQSEGSPWCNRRCADLPEPTPVMSTDRPPVYILAYEPSVCGPGQAAFGGGDCRDIHPCGGAPNVPPGPRHDVGVGERLQDAITSNPGATVFVLPAATYDEDVVIDRPVTLWGRCPTETMVRRVTLSAGGTVAQLTATSSVIAAGDTSLIRIVAGGVGLSDGISSAAGIHVDGDLDVDNATVAIADTVLTRGRMTVKTSSVVVRQLRAYDQGHVRVQEETVMTMLDTAFFGPSSRFVETFGSRVELKRSAMRGAQLHGLYAVDSIVAVRDVFVDDADISFWVLRGRLDAKDVQVERSDQFLFVDGQQGAPHQLARVTLGSVGAGIVLSGDVGAPTQLVVSDLRHARGAVGIRVRELGNLRVQRASFTGVEVPIEADRFEALDLREIDCREAPTMCLRTRGNGPIVVDGLFANNCTLIADLRPIAINGPTPELRFSRVGALASGGFVVRTNTFLVLEDFAMIIGVGTAMEVEDDAVIRLANGRIDEYEVGMDLPAALPPATVIDRVGIVAGVPVRSR